MKLLLIASSIALALATSSALLAEQTSNGKPLVSSAPRLLAVNNQTAVACNLCYTCGGDWPVLAGIMPTASGQQTYERGSGCSGSLGWRADNSPYLCCR